MSVTELPRTRDRRFGTVSKVLAAFTGTAVLGGLIAAGIAMPAVGVVGSVTNSAVNTFDSLPSDIDTPSLPQRVQIVDSGGGHLAWYYTENRQVVSLPQMGRHLPQAIVAIEDERFYDHEGVDLRGTLRALATNSGAGEIQQGGSTITQQYVKMILLTNAKTKEEQLAATERSVTRKLREASFAMAIEKELTKEQILEGYLNIAYYGSGAYGAEVAAQRYFSRPAAKLTLSQAAVLAGVVQQPGAFDPIRNPKASQVRRDEVLRKMLAQGMITQGEYSKAVSRKVKGITKPQELLNGCPGTTAPYFCDYVLQTIKTNPDFGKTRKQREALLARGGFKVRTTLDPRVQKVATEAVFNHIPKDDPSRKAVAISMVEPGSGKIIAMTQNREWGTSGTGKTTYNYNVEAKLGGTLGMQSGSTFKVFTLAAALERGISPYSQIAAPQTKTFVGFQDCNGFYFPPYTVENSTGAGTFNMFTGTAQSVNTYFIGLEQQVDMCRQAEIAEAMGLKKGNGEKLERVPSFPLGANEITPLGLANGYATFANRGSYCEPMAITKVQRFNKGRVVYDGKADCRQVVAPYVADQVNQILVGVVNNGTGRAMALGRPTAGKTGTTDSNAAVWFAGYTPQVAAAAWVGDPRGGFAYPLRDIVINGTYHSRGYGSTLAGPVWRTAMLAALEGKEVKGFAPPSGAPGQVLGTPTPEVGTATAASTAGDSQAGSTGGTQSNAQPSPPPAADGGGDDDGGTDFGRRAFEDLDFSGLDDD